MTVYVFQFCFCAFFLLLLLRHRLLSFRFESKLVSHLARGFDPFKPLSINTNAIESSAASAAPGNAIMKKPSVLYDSLHHHPLHQMQVQQQQQQHPQQHAYHQQHQHQQQQQQLTTTAPKMTVPTAATAAATTTTITSLTTPTTNLSSTATTTSVVDGQRYSRMEIYKASVANTTIDHPSNNSNSKSPHTCL